MQTIDIAKDFSDVPAGRYLSDGKFSGQKFREEWLVPVLEKNEPVKVILDGAEGYGSSFLEEAFGGLIREHGFDKKYLDNNLIIVSNSSEYEIYKEISLEYIAEAEEKNTQNFAAAN